MDQGLTLPIVGGAIGPASWERGGLAWLGSGTCGSGRRNAGVADRRRCRSAMYVIGDGVTTVIVVFDVIAVFSSIARHLRVFKLGCKEKRGEPRGVEHGSEG